MRNSNYLLRVFPKSLFLLTVLAGIAFAGSVVYVERADDFGLVYENEHGLADQQALSVTAKGSDEVFGFEIGSTVGGVVLQAIADIQPETGNLTISYVPTLQDGRRFTATIAGKTGVISASDWLMVPLIRFVESGNTAAISLLGKAKAAEYRATNKRLMFVEIHPSFQNTVLGNNFIFTDAMLVDASPNRIRRVTENLSGPIPGYTDVAAFDEDQSKSAASIVSSQLFQFQWNTYVFTDVDVKFTASIRNNSLVMEGGPYYAFLNIDLYGRTSDLNVALTSLLREDPNVRELNPKIYDLDRLAFQITALLRRYRTFDPDKWRLLVKEVSSVSPEPSMATPRAFRPLDVLQP